jgi:A/G-specific adenine glycosylase
VVTGFSEKSRENKGPRQGAPVARDLLAWYDRSARALPWREPPGVRADAYRVWLSEIMLQQTTVKAVIPFYRKFLVMWPAVSDLAGADLDDVLAAWAGLGYYSRARNLHACAKAVVERHGGRFPASEAALLDLPGIGAYTAAAIVAIAFDQRATAVDGNVERVVARLFAVEEPLPGAKPRIKTHAASLVPDRRPGDFTQAMMDLGATICSPRSPSCMICPLADHCAGRAQGIAERLPAKAPKTERPIRYGAAFVALSSDGAVLLRKRPPKGLLGGMLEPPSSAWGQRLDLAKSLQAAPCPGDWRRVPGIVVHTFTHFHLELEVYLASGIDATFAPEHGRWYAQNELADAALPSVMRKILAHAFDETRALNGRPSSRSR